MVLFASLLLVVAQNGDRAGEPQPPLPADLKVPAAPARTPEEQLATFRLPPGFRMELVAAEPFVHDPVFATFDGEGRMWVVEMRGLMPNVDGTGEDEPVGSIAILEDRDGDGAMDHREVFLDGLVMPRGVLPMRGGALVLLPPDLVWVRDTDDDGEFDEWDVIDTGFTEGLANPEHAINGLMVTRDNWIRCARHRVEYRWKDGVWERRVNAGGGQWGITQDDWGYAYFNGNSDPLRGDLVPSHLVERNPNHGRATGANVRMATDMRTWPSRITPGVNRGYRKGTLRDDFKLRVVTGACSPGIYRGANWPEEFQGNAFVCEPAGNLIKRYVLTQHDDGRRTAVCEEDELDFLTSTDERFRPVHLFNGPSGDLYVVDLYRGILQHRVFLTTFLRNQILDRRLDQHIGLGRIWRIKWVGDGERAGGRLHEAAMPPPKLGSAPWHELAVLLEHPHGWWRDHAQREMVERGSMFQSEHDILNAIALRAADPRARVHALWTQHGIGIVDEVAVARGLDHEHVEVQLAALRAGAHLIGRREELPPGRIAALARGGGPRLRQQALLSLGSGAGRDSLQAMAEILIEDCSTPELRSAALSSVQSREFDFLEVLLREGRWMVEAKGRDDVVRLLARAVAREGQAERLEKLLTLAGAEEVPRRWQRRAILKGTLEGRPKSPSGGAGHFVVAAKPASFDALRKIDADAGGEDGKALADAIVWPGRDDIDLELPEPLTAEEQAWFEAGRASYAANCASCHQPSGRGLLGTAPRLRYSEYVLGDQERLIKIVMHGLSGPLRMDNEDWNMEMPAFSASDAEIAAVLTYVRREWGHGVSAVSPAEVTAIRNSSDRMLPWTIAELAAEAEAAAAREPATNPPESSESGPR